MVEGEREGNPDVWIWLATGSHQAPGSAAWLDIWLAIDLATRRFPSLFVAPLVVLCAD